MTQLIKLLAANKTRQSQHTSRIVAAETETTLYLYDAIVSDDLSADYFGGVSAQTLVPQIRAITSGTIELRINSAGGDVFAAQAIAQAICDTGAKVIARIDGLAASAASVVAMAADEIHMAEGAFFMIHNAWTMAIGNANELIDTAALLEKIDHSIACQYSQRSGISTEEIHKWMDAETWFTAQEALDARLVDHITAGQKAAANWDLSAYAHAPHSIKDKQNKEERQTTEHRQRQSQRLALLNRLSVNEHYN